MTPSPAMPPVPEKPEKEVRQLIAQKCSAILDECERNEQAASCESERLWMRAYAAGARRLAHDVRSETG